MKCVFIKGKASHFAITDKSENTYYRETHDLMLEGGCTFWVPCETALKTLDWDTFALRN